MTKEVYFKDFEGLIHHYQFIDEQLEKSIGKFEGFRPIKLRVNIDSLTPRKLFQGPQYGCEIIAHHPEIRNSIVVHKFSKDFYQSVRQACKAVETVLRKHSKSKPALRRRAYDTIAYGSVMSTSMSSPTNSMAMQQQGLT